MISILAYIGAAIAEIAGCFAVWAVVRLDKPVWWLLPGLLSLALCAWLLTLVDSLYAGRAYAAYGGVYIAASLVWLWARRRRPPRPLGPDRRRRLPRRHGDYFVWAEGYGSGI